MIKLLMLVSEKPNLEQNLINVKLHSGPVEKNVLQQRATFS